MLTLQGVLRLSFVLVALSAYAQAPTNTVGAVTKLDIASSSLTLKTDAGIELAVQMAPNVAVRRVAPGETNLANATPIAVTDIALGDRVLARGVNANQIVSATLIVVVSQGDIKKKQAAERADWDRRGVVGIVTAVAADSVSIRSRTLAGTGLIVVAPKPGAAIRKYEPDSINFADAKPANFRDIKTGDQVRARGDKSPDGARLTAEEMIFGTFKTIAAVVVSVDAPAGEIKINDLDSKKVMTVKVNKDSVMRKLPPPLAQSIAARVHGQARAAAAPAGAPPAGGGSAPDLQQIIERSPALTLADLKARDAIVVSSTVGATADRITAITLLAGVEPILTKPGTQQMSLGAWTLDVGGGAQ